MKKPKFVPDFDRKNPDGDDRERNQCNHCGYVEYENPKIVTGTVATWEDKILLCRRAIEPRVGFWTLPAGYMELGESVEAAALREAWEEARADITIDQILAIYSVPRISQVQVMFRGVLNSPNVSAGPESLEVGLFHWREIPWDEIAFPTAAWALRHFQESKGQAGFQPFTNPR